MSDAKKREDAPISWNGILPASLFKSGAFPHMTRRDLLRASAMVGASATVGGLLAACTSSSGSGGSASAAGSGSQSGAGAGAVATSGSAADMPAKLKGKKIGFVQICAGCSGEARINQALSKECEARDWELIVVDGQGDLAKSLAGFENFIEAKVDCIINGIVDTTAVGDVLRKANAAKIPFIIESQPWVPGAILQVGMNSWQMGMTQAMWVADRMGYRGNVAMLTAPVAQNVNQRERVFKSVISWYPEMKIIEEHAMGFVQPVNEARQVMEEWLLKHPKNGEIGAVWAGWDDPAIGAALAVDAAGRSNEMFIIGNDAGQDALEKIRGTYAFDGTVLVDYETIGVTLAQQMEKIFLSGKPDATNIYVDQPIISRHLNNVPPPGQLAGPVKAYSVWPRPLSETLSYT